MGRNDETFGHSSDRGRRQTQPPSAGQQRRGHRTKAVNGNAAASSNRHSVLDTDSSEISSFFKPLPAPVVEINKYNDEVDSGSSRRSKAKETGPRPKKASKSTPKKNAKIASSKGGKKMPPKKEAAKSKKQTRKRNKSARTDGHNAGPPLGLLEGAVGEFRHRNVHVPTGRSNLHEGTITALESYIQTHSYIRDELNEDEVAAIALATHRNADSRTRYRKNLMSDFNVPEAESEYLSNRIYQEEEYYSLADNHFNDLVEGAAAKANFNLEKRTLAWIKRAAGLQKPDDPLEKYMGYFSESGDEGEQSRSGRRRTRGSKKQVKAPRIAKVHEGIEVFTDAIKEIEEERGINFDRNTHSYSASESSDDESMSLETDDIASHTSMSDNTEVTSVPAPMESVKIRDYPPGSEMIASGISKHSDDIRLWVLLEGQVVSNASKNELDTWTRSKKQQRGEREEQANKRVKLSEQTTTVTKTDPAVKPLQNCHDQISSTRGHLELALPDLDKSMESYIHTGMSKLVVTMAKNKHTHISSMICSMMYRFLGSRARKWARYEYFYPEVDAPWYEFDPRAATIASWVPPETKLSWQEWRSIRRQLKRPRRFSGKFIADEILKRNEYRRMVRCLQRNPDVHKGQGFPVPPILEPGTVVTAYNKQHQIIHRGTVLFYSLGDDGYFVQFDSEELGCEFCPDTEVSRVTWPVPSLPGSMKPSMARARVASMDDVKAFDPNDRSYERHNLYTLAVNVERVLERKALILDAIEESNRMDIPYPGSQLRNIARADPVRSEEVQFTISSWLHANLILANRSLDEAVKYLRAAYPDESGPDGMDVDIPDENTTPSNGKGPEIIEPSRRSFLAEKLIARAGISDKSQQLQQYAEALLEMEVRKMFQSLK